MKSLPVIFLAFANDRMDGSGYLRNLPVEQRKITEVLEPAVEAGLCELLTISNATIRQILDTFQKKKYKDRIAIFHYGGHADGYQLLLETEKGDKSVAHGEGLVSFLSQQQGLQLIFLNGCSTERQSQELVDEGVPLVIGTTSSIGDDIATELAVRFYSSMGNGANIARAWREAKDEANMRANKIADVYRKIDWSKEAGSEDLDSLPWRFFVKEGAEIVKEWNLPDAAEDPLFALPDAPLRDLPEEPFRFLKWYEEEHAEIFFGRSYFIRDLYERITDPNAAPLILLHGKSGVGKSSLLDAGLLPRLKQSSEVVYVRRNHQISLLESLRMQLTSSVSSKVDTVNTRPLEMELKELEDLLEKSTHPLVQEQLSLSIKNIKLKKDHKALGKSAQLKDLWLAKEEIFGKPFVIILDQVEGIYTEASEAKAGEMDELLEALREVFKDISNRPVGKLMMSYRKEYHPEIEKACKSLQIPREQVFLEPLTRRDIMEVVKGLTRTERLRRTYSLEVEELLPGIIADDLLVDNNSSIAPILQILLTKMWQLTDAEARVFSVANYTRLQKEGILLDDFFEQQIEKVKAFFPEPETSGLIIDLLNFHTTDLSTARTVDLETLALRYQHREDVLEKVIRKLKELYLLADMGSQTSLAHDTLAPLVQKEFKDSDRPGQRAYRVLDNKIALYEASKDVVIDEDDLELVEEGKAGMRFWVKKEQELIEKSRKRKAELVAERLRNRRFKQIAVAALAIFAMVVSFLGYNAYQEAQANEKVAMALEVEKTDATKALRLTEEGLNIRPKNQAIQQILGRIYGTNEFYQSSYSHTSPVTALAISSDGKLLLSGDDEGRLWRWDEKGKLLDSVSIHEDKIRAIQFSPDGQYYATGSDDNRVLIWTLKGERFQELEGHKYAVASLAFSPDGKQLLTGTRDGMLRIWSWESALLDTSLKAHATEVYSLDYAADSRLFISGSDDGTAKIWAKDVELMTTLTGHKDRVLSARFSPDSEYVLTGSRDKTAILWDSTGRRIAQLFGHTGRINQVAFAPGNENLITLSDDQRMIEWNRGGVQLKTYMGHSNYVNDLAILEEGNILFTASDDGFVKKWLYDAKLEAKINHFGPHVDPPGYSLSIGAAAFSPDGLFLSTGGYKAYLDPIEEEFDMDDKSQKIKVWDLEKGTAIDLAGHKDGIKSIAFSPDSRSLVSGAKDGSVRLWGLDTPSGENSSKVLRTHGRECSIVAWASYGSFFLSAGEDSLAKIWDEKGEELASFAHGDWITSAAISPDGKTIVTGGMDTKIKLWEVGQPQKEATEWLGHKRAVVSLAFSPDGKYVASGDESNTLMIWNTKGKLLLTKKHDGKNVSGFGAINSISFSKDSRQLVYGAVDGTARVIDLDGTILQTLTHASSSIATVAFSPDGNSILTAGSDGNAYFHLSLDNFLKSTKVAKIQNNN